jgi:hypothetical protein
MEPSALTTLSVLCIAFHRMPDPGLTRDWTEGVRSY